MKNNILKKQAPRQNQIISAIMCDKYICQQWRKVV